MNGYGSRNRLLDKQRKQKRKVGFWPVLALILLGVNIYLFGIRGIPGGEAPGSRPDASPVDTLSPALPPPSPAPAPAEETRPFESGLGEMDGVAGIRSSVLPAGRVTPLRAFDGALQKSRQRIRDRGRFNLQAAEGVSGQRTMEEWCNKEQGSIEQGDTLSTALMREGLSAREANNIIQALRPVFDFRHCRKNDRFEIWTAPDGSAHRFEYRKNPLVSYRVDRRANKLTAKRIERPVQVQTAEIAVRIQGSLWQSLLKAGEDDALVMMIVDIFAWDIDFYVDTHPGDTVRLVVEKHEVDGQFVDYGRILAAEYSGVVGVHRAFWYESQAGPDGQSTTSGYFDAQGGSLRKAFLKSPLKFARISSRYGMRVHPVLGFNKMHAGIDFAAPVGTPIWAPADGTVTFAGRKGANGILITMRHANGYETAFAHLSKISAGVRGGVRVRQKQVIGLVGNTGRSTGPHLHYGMKLRSRNVNPMGQKFPPAKPVPVSEITAYKKSIAPLIKQLGNIALPGADRTAAAAAEKKNAG